MSESLKWQLLQIVSTYKAFSFILLHLPFVWISFPSERQLWMNLIGSYWNVKQLLVLSDLTFSLRNVTVRMHFCVTLSAVFVSRRTLFLPNSCGKKLEALFSNFLSRDGTVQFVGEAACCFTKPFFCSGFCCFRDVPGACLARGRVCEWAVRLDL